MACEEPELNGSCYYPVGRGLRLPSRRKVAASSLLLQLCACQHEAYALGLVA